jgi:hypothetical protein
MKSSGHSAPTDSIHFDKIVVSESVENKGEYKTDFVTVKRWGDAVGEKKKYILITEDESFKFKGIVNLNFEREGYGINQHENGEKYLGYYQNNLRNGHGFYSYLPDKKDNQLLSEYYYGLWKDDLKNGYGVYLWLNEDVSKKPFTDFDHANFQAFVGDAENDIFKKGTLLSKEGEDYLVYHGTFNTDGKKQGPNCFFYSASLEELCFGEYSNDIFVKGYVVHFNEDGNVKDFLKYNDGQILKKDKVDEEEFKKNTKIMVDFRNVIMGKDYFGSIYNGFGKIKNFEETKITSADFFNSDEYSKLMEMAVAYNQISIYKDIEQMVEYNK